MLVASLALLVLAAALMVSFSRAALAQVVCAREVQWDLQKRWGELSCRKAVLPYADAILTAAEQRQNKPVPVYRVRVSLAGEDFDLTLSDEQSKANLNGLLESTDVASAETRVREALTGTGMANRLKLRPALHPATRPASVAPSTQPGAQGAARIAPPDWLTGFGQVFGPMQPDELLAVGFVRIAPMDLITCWGDGSINLRRVPEAALKLAAMPPLSGAEVGRLLDTRNHSFEVTPKAARRPESGVDGSDWLKVSGVDEKHRLGLPPMGGTSTCFSLWVVVRTPRRNWYTLTVADGSDINRPRTVRFVW